MKNIVLCGFMGSGKSSVGTALALLSKMRFIDMDRYIEKQEKQTISAIFQKYGEDHFRDLESRCAAKLSTQSNQIIATGGGAVLRPQNIRSFRSNGIIVFLNIPFPMVRKRLRGDKTRPLLKTSPSVVHALYKKRMPIERHCADITVNNHGNLSVNQMAERVWSAVQKFPNSNQTGQK